MSVVSIKGNVVAAFPTKGGGWLRVMLGGTGRINDLVMVPADHEVAAKIKTGQPVELVVRPAVDTNADGRPTKTIVYFLADSPGAAA